MSKENKKILVFTVAAWNSKVGANSWATLLESYDSSNIANLCIRDEVPDSRVASRYFSISENKIIKSVFKRGLQTGREIEPCATEEEKSNLDAHNARYRKMKQKRRSSMLLARELIWKLGKWKTKELDAFLDDFQPDIILHSMEGYIHLNRIIEYAIKRTGARAIGYVWDDNFTYKQSNKLGYKIYRFFQRGSLKRLAKKTSDFFAITPMTKREADAFFGISCHLLTKPLYKNPVVSYGEIGAPIRLLYTGNLYIGRDQSLLKVVNAIKAMPKGRFLIDAYINSPMDAEWLAQIDPEICRIHAPIPQSEVFQKQREADVLLFLEDIDGPDARVARLSFSTKITDYLSAGKCILAVGNGDTAPLQYFIENNAALVCVCESDIAKALERVSDSPELLLQLAQNAAEAGQKNHNKEDIQNVFDSVIAKN